MSTVHPPTRSNTVTVHRTTPSHSPGAAALAIAGPSLEQPPRNRLLASLPRRELAALWPFLEHVQLEPREELFATGAPIRHVYFPHTAIVSVVTELADGGSIEVGTVGCEGMAGLTVFLGDDIAFVRAFVQIPGGAMRMDAERFARLTDAPGAFHWMMRRYALVFLTQVAQTAACNGAHLVEQRCARWLLMTHDRVEGDSFALTHEFLALMLGVRRAGVTLAMRALYDAGLIRYSRGHVAIVDRAGLERVSCECYGAVRANAERLLGRATRD